MREMDGIVRQHRASWVATVLAGAMTPAAVLWVLMMRRAGRRGGRLLTTSELVETRPFFSDDLLVNVRIGDVSAITRSRLTRLAHAIGIGVVDPRVVRGMALIDTVLIEPGASGDMSLLFHELVHIAQYRKHGLCTFLFRYLRDWLAGGRSYLGIGAEDEAYALQARFEDGDSFRVAECIR